MSQTDRLLKRLKRGPLTPLQAWRELGIYRAAARVLDLRRAGHDIVSEPVTVRGHRVVWYAALRDLIQRRRPAFVAELERMKGLRA